MFGSHTIFLYTFALYLSCGSSSSFRAAIGVYNITETHNFLGSSSRRLDIKTPSSPSWSNLENTSVKYPLRSQSRFLATTTPRPLSSFGSNLSGGNVSNPTSESGTNTCWFLVQDTLDVRYWPVYQTQKHTTIKVFATSITYFADTTVSHLRTFTSRLNTTSTVVVDQGSDSLSPGCSFSNRMLTSSSELQGIVNQLYGSPIKSPQAFYLYSHVKILSVPPVTNDEGQQACGTTSTNAECGCVFSHCNEHVFANFGTPNARLLYADITLSTPFSYIPIQSGVGSEAFGYVPQSMINWMVQDPNYIEKYPHLFSCQPGGPKIFISTPGDSYGRLPGGEPEIYHGGNQVHQSARQLTSSMIVTVHSDGCYNQYACPTSPAPGANAQAPTPDVTGGPTIAPTPASNLQSSDGISTPESIRPHEYHPPAALEGVNSNPYSPVSTVPANPEHVESAAGNSATQKADGETPGDDPLDPDRTPSEEKLPPENPTPAYQRPPQHQALASIIVNALGGAPIAEADSDKNHNIPLKSQQVPSYVISLAPSASAVVVNGIASSILKPANAGASPIVTINSQPTTLGTVPELVFDGQNVVAGAPTAMIHGVPVSLAPLASAIVVDGHTTPLSPGQTPIITLGPQPVTAYPMSRYVLGGQTLVPGAAAITLSGTPISVPTEGNAVIIGGSTVAIPNTPGPGLPEITLGNRVITANSASQFLLGDQTLVPGAPAITVAAPAGAIAAFGPSPTALTVGRKVFTPNPTAFAIDGTTISAGGPVMTVDGTPIRLGASGILDIGGSTMSLPVNDVSPTVYTIGAQVFTPNPTAFSIFGTTISAGGPGATVDGTVVSLGRSGVLEIGSSTISLGVDAASPTPTAYAVGNQVFTPNPTAFSIDGTTISAGGPGVTIDGTIVSLGSSGILNIGSSTISLALSSAYTVGGKIFTPNPTAFSIDGTIISAGGSGVNIDGTLVSLEASGILDIGSSRVLLPPSNVYTVGGQTFTPDPTVFSIDGTIISAGGLGVTIDGTIVSLGSSGILDIGSSRILLPTSNVYTVGGETFTPNPTAFQIDGTTISAAGPGVTIDGTVVSLGASGILYIGSSTISLLSGNTENAGTPFSLATSPRLDLADSTISLTNGDSALTTTTAGPGPGATSSSTLPRSTHSGGEAQTSRPRIGRIGITLIIGCVVMLR